MLRELPPTAGLRPRWGEMFASFFGSSDLSGRIAAFLGCPEVVLTSSGSAALVIAFEYLKSVSGRRTVIIPGYTCPLVVLAAEQAGLSVAVCDTVAGGFDLDLNCLQGLLDNDILCVVPTHYGGALADTRRIRELVEASSHDITIIEDAAQAFGARNNGAMAGMTGHIGIFSFAAGKGFTLFEGGCLYGETADIRRGLRETALKISEKRPFLELRRSAELAAYYALYNRIGLSLSYGVPRRYWLKRNDRARAIGDYFELPIPIHSIGKWRGRIGVRAIARLDEHLKKSGDRYKELSSLLQRVSPGIDVHIPARELCPTGTFVFVTLPSGEACNAALTQLWPSRAGVSKLFACALSEYPYLSDRDLESTPNASDIARRTLTVTTSSMMKESELSWICEILELSCQSLDGVIHRK